MKPKIISFWKVLGCALGAALCSSCAAELLDEPGSATPPDASGQQSVQFSVFNESVSRLDTRDATTPTASHLLILDVSAQETKVYTRGTGTSTDLDNKGVLDPLNLSLTYGAHTLYFLAANTAFASYDKAQKTVTWNSQTAALKYCWAQKLELTVSAATESQQLSLPNRVAMVSVELSDVIPTGVNHFDLSLSAGSWTLNLATMQSANNGLISRTIDVPASSIGHTTTLGIYTFIPANQASVGTLTATAYDSDSNPIAAHQVTNVPVQEAYQTNYKGNFFHTSVGTSLSLTPQFGKTEAGSF